MKYNIWHVWCHVIYYTLCCSFQNFMVSTESYNLYPHSLPDRWYFLTPWCLSVSACIKLIKGALCDIRPSINHMQLNNETIVRMIGASHLPHMYIGMQQYSVFYRTVRYALFGSISWPAIFWYKHHKTLIIKNLVLLWAMTERYISLLLCWDHNQSEVPWPEAYQHSSM